MDDLAGLNWTSSTSNSKQQQAAPTNANYYPTLRPTPPLSGRSTPANAQQQSGLKQGLNQTGGSAKSPTPANDSFANLVPFGASQSTKSVSLQEQQKALEAQKARQLGLSGLAAPSSQPTSTATSGRSTPNPTLPPTLSGLASQNSSFRLSPAPGASGSSPRAAFSAEKEEDILAAFDSRAPVDSSSHFPPPSSSHSASISPAPAQRAFSQSPKPQDFSSLDDDDPFGLGAGTSTSTTKSVPNATQDADANGDDDVLGLLGKPVSELPPRSEETEPPAKRGQSADDKALAELVDMGFPPEKAQEALAHTESGTDIQAAVGWLLNQAHARSRGKADSSSKSRDRNGTSSRAGPGEDDASAPAWMHQQSRSESASRRENSNSPMPNDERDPTKTAAEISSNLFKTANSFWKSSQKKLNKAIAEFNADADSNQPKWMRETQLASAEEQPKMRRAQQQPEVSKPSVPQNPRGAGLIDMTDEAKMLESGGSRPQPRKKQTFNESQQSPPTSRTQSPLASGGRPPPQPARPSRRIVEEETAQAYVSPARRRRVATPPVAAAEPEPDPDLLLGDSKPNGTSVAKPTRTSAPTSQTKPQPRAKSAPIPTRPKAPSRSIPPLSSIALQSSTSHRLKGNAAFKLGNYGEANEAYTNSLREIPSSHPLAILLLTNRALTNLKTGDPKACIADADMAIETIGPSRGQDEEIDIGGDEGKKPMAPFWGKAMMRRAEALEQLERWADAAKAWADCVQAGVGGAQSIQARTRCERAANPKAAVPPRPKPAAKRPTPRPTARASALDDLSGRPAPTTTDSGEAVTRLRAANAAAEKADDEKFALADSVDARLTAWRKGKEGNLRALLGSLDTVLWEGANWKKVGMSELIVPGKVKVAYMKGIAKVHPDKLSPSATTEQVMISGAVFSALNEAWDKFKTQNNL